MEKKRNVDSRYIQLVLFLKLSVCKKERGFASREPRVQRGVGLGVGLKCKNLERFYMLRRGSNLFPSSLGCVITGRHRNLDILDRVTGQTNSPHVCGIGLRGEGRAVMGERVSYLKIASNSVLLGHAQIFLYFVPGCGNEMSSSR